MLRYNYNFLRTKNELFKFHRLKSKCIVLPKNKLGKGIVILGNIKLGERERERQRERGRERNLNPQASEVKETVCHSQGTSHRFKIGQSNPFS